MFLIPFVVHVPIVVDDCCCMVFFAVAREHLQPLPYLHRFIIIIAFTKPARMSRRLSLSAGCKCARAACLLARVVVFDRARFFFPTVGFEKEMQ